MCVLLLPHNLRWPHVLLCTDRSLKGPSGSFRMIAIDIWEKKIVFTDLDNPSYITLIRSD